MNSIKTQAHMVQRYASYDRSSEEERRVDALALRADERRDKLRKASGRSKYPLIRRYLNAHLSDLELLTPLLFLYTL